MRYINSYSEMKNVLSGRPKVEVLHEGSDERLGRSEFHVDGPVTANVR